jgi:hypothetical protein
MSTLIERVWPMKNMYSSSILPEDDPTLASWCAAEESMVVDTYNQLISCIDNKVVSLRSRYAEMYTSLILSHAKCPEWIKQDWFSRVGVR